MDRQHRGGRGFTLTELLITLMVAGVLLAAGAPAMGSLIARTRNAGAEAAVADTLRHARGAAVMRNVRVLVCPSSDGRRCDGSGDWRHGWTVAPDADRDGQPDSGRPIIAVQDAMPGGTRVITTAGRAKLTFQPTGSAGGSNVTFTICHLRERTGRSVVVANSGRVRITDADPSHLRDCLAGS